ncbi:polysaccharide biosynthesis/export family protein [Rhizobium giardinii]|uniref:polysaccharide biosynthesis/export family protein n=1 Tax=Rhizobium giardinii TaxID=56731 RepID=UPI003D6E3831
MQFSYTLARLSLTVACIAMSSCTMLSSNPLKDVHAPYTLIDVTPNVVTVLSREVDTERASSGNTKKRTSGLIGVGDTVTISIWEASDEGLFGGGTLIPAQPVSEAGTIAVPYGGTVKAAGRTPHQLKKVIEKALGGMAVDPQVLVSVINNISNAVTVTGEVVSSGRIPLSLRGEKLLDVIAVAGGPRIESHLISVYITRSGTRMETIPLEQLMSDPSKNIYVQPDDVVVLVRQPRNFTVFGAAIANAVIQFDESQLYLDQALAKVGGLNDERANAEKIFISRTESTAVLRRLMPAKSFLSHGLTTNVTYQIDLSDSNGFFLLKSFKIRNGDLVYIANAS